MPDQPRDEREFNAALELHTSGRLSGGKAGVSHQRLWDRRVDKFVAAVLASSGKSRKELARHVDAADEFADLMAIAGNRAGERGDGQYRDILARLVGAALLDKTEIDKIAYIVARIVRLEPVHVRLLTAAHSAESLDARKVEEIEGGRNRRHLSKEEEFELWKNEKPAVYRGMIRIEELARQVRMDAGVVESCLMELADQGLVRRQGGDFRPDDATRTATVAPVEWRMTRLGRSAAAEIERLQRDLR
jgi:hypothetical protein